MPRSRAVLVFALRFFSILGVYLLPWAAVGVAYSSVAAALGNAVFGPAFRLAGFELAFTGSELGVAQDMEAAFAVHVRATELQHGIVVPLQLDLRTLTYVPTAVFVALAIAAPIWDGRRGLRVLAAGLLALHVFFAASLAVTIVLFLSTTPGLHPLLGPGARVLLQVLHRVFVAPPGMAVAVPALTWLLLAWLVPESAPRAPPRDAPVAAA